MAQNVVQLKRTAVPGKVPNTSILQTGELALNLADKTLFSSDGTTVFEIGANTTNQSVTGTLTANNISSSNVSTEILTSNTILSNNQTVTGTLTANNVSSSNVTVTNVLIPTSLLASGSTGGSRQVLASNNGVLYWRTLSEGSGFGAAITIDANTSLDIDENNNIFLAEGALTQSEILTQAEDDALALAIALG